MSVLDTLGYPCSNLLAMSQPEDEESNSPITNSIKSFAFGSRPTFFENCSIILMPDTGDTIASIAQRLG
jgi:hypothetical protein